MPLFTPSPLIPQLMMINLKDYCKIDGNSDDSIGFTKAYQLAASKKMGLFHPGGTLIKGNDTLCQNVPIIGIGPGVSVFKLKNGANTDLFSAQTNLINLSASSNSGLAGTLFNFSIQGITLDGNKANQAGVSYPLRFYGYNFILRDMEILNGLSGGALIDWNGGGSLPIPSDQMESVIDTIKFHDNNGIGLQMGGPHDSRMHNALSFLNQSHNFHFTPNADGILGSNCHGWGSPNIVGVCNYLIESDGCQFINSISDGGYYVGIAILGKNTTWSGSVYADEGTQPNAQGIQFGQHAGNTPFPGQINQASGVTTSVAASASNIFSQILGCNAGSLSFQNENNNIIIANIFQTSGVEVIGTIDSTDTYIANVSGMTQTIPSQLGLQGNILGQHLGINTTINASVSVLIDPGANGNKGLVIYPHSSSQTANLLEVQNSSFGPVFAIDQNGNVNFSGHAGYNTGYNANVALLVNTGTDTTTGLVIFPSNPTQSAPLLAIQNDSFNNVFTVDLKGNASTATLSTAESATTAATATGGTIATVGIGESKVAPTGNITGVILQAGTIPGQEVTVTNNSAFTITFAAAGTSQVADGTSAVIAANRAMFFKWSGSSSKWFHS